MSKISAIRSATGIIQEMDRRSYPYRKQGRTYGSNRCPHCGDGSKHSNKLNVYVGSDGFERYKCMACGKHGDVIDFVMAVEGLSQQGAIEMLARQSGRHAPARREANHPKPTGDQQAAGEELPVASDAMKEAVGLIRTHCVDRTTLDYLVMRGMTRPTIEMAVATGMLCALPPDPGTARADLIRIVGKDRLIAAGLMRSDSDWPAAAFMPLIGIPPGDSAIQCRRIKPARNDSDPRYIIYGRVRWPYTVRKSGTERPKTVAIVEGMIDALSFSECEEARTTDVILGIPGTSAWKPAWIAAIRERAGPDGTLILALDDNHAGDACSQAIQEFLDQSGGAMKTFRMRPPLQDWNRTLKQRKEEKNDGHNRRSNAGDRNTPRECRQAQHQYPLRGNPA